LRNMPSRASWPGATGRKLLAVLFRSVTRFVAWLMRIDCIEDDRGMKGKLVVISIQAEQESHRWRESL